MSMAESHTATSALGTDGDTRLATLPPPLPIAEVAIGGGEERQAVMGQLLTHTPRIEILNQYDDSVIVAIPMHNAPERKQALEAVFDSIANQRYEGRLKVVIGDNGMSYELRRDVQAMGDANALSYLIIDAPPNGGDKKSAAHARNKLLRAIFEREAQDPGVDPEGILLLDSDTAAEPTVVARLQETARDHRAIAVTSRSIPVPYLDAETYFHYFSTIDLQTNEVRPLPVLIGDGHVDMATLVAGSGDVATKTCGLYLDAHVIQDLLDHNPNLFIRMPMGSAEDMFLSLVLSQLGTLYHNPQAIILDQSRLTSQETRIQRSRWGYDHVILTSDLAAMRLIKPGLHVLEPQEGSWVEWTVPQTERMRGFFVNPQQAQVLRDQLVAMVRAEGFKIFASSLSFPISEKQLTTGIAVLDRLLRYIEAVRPYAQYTKRVDLPPSTPIDSSLARWSPDSQVGQLSGNIGGMHAITSVDPSSVPSVVFFGVRQGIY